MLIPDPRSYNTVCVKLDEDARKDKEKKPK